MEDPLIQSLYGWIIPPEGEPVGVVTGTENLGAWNENRVTIVHGRRSVDWEQTIRARISNAPALYAGAGLVAAYLVVKVLR